MIKAEQVVWTMDFCEAHDIRTALEVIDARFLSPFLDRLRETDDETSVDHETRKAAELLLIILDELPDLYPVKRKKLDAVLAEIRGSK